MLDINMRPHIRESNRIEGITDPAEVDQSLKAWAYLIGQDDLSHEVVRETQRLVTLNQTDLAENQKGHYRSVSKVNVRVGSYVAPPWQDVDDLMTDWLNQYPRLSPWLNHVQFEGVHPFRDGNGRVGRLLMWWQEVRAGQEPRLFKAADRFDYYAELDHARRLMAAAEWESRNA